MPKLILLDTNFLMIPFQFRVDIFSELERACDFGFRVAVLDRTLEELENIKKKQRRKQRTAAESAINLLKRKNLKIIRTNSGKSTDDLIAEFAEKGAIIATQDSALRKIIKKKGGRTIFLRNKKFIRVD